MLPRQHPYESLANALLFNNKEYRCLVHHFTLNNMNSLENFIRFKWAVEVQWFSKICSNYWTEPVTSLFANKNCIRSTCKKVKITRINQIHSIFSHDAIHWEHWVNTKSKQRLLLKYDKHLQLWNFVVYHLICIYAKLLSVQLYSFHSS